MKKMEKEHSKSSTNSKKTKFEGNFKSTAPKI
jgi:hypothetical protein